MTTQFNRTNRTNVTKDFATPGAATLDTFPKPASQEKWKTLDASVLQATEALDEKKAETQKLMEEKQEEPR